MAADEQRSDEQRPDETGESDAVEAVDVDSGGYRGPDPEADAKGDGSDEDQGT
jgi:hypothetical protein